MNKKKIILLVIALIIIIVLSFVLYNVNKQEVEEDRPINGISGLDNSEIIKDKIVGDLKFSKVSFVVIDGETHFHALVSNLGNESIDIKELYVNFLGDGIDESMLALSDMTIKANNSQEIRILIDKDLSKANNVKYVIES